MSYKTVNKRNIYKTGYSQYRVRVRRNGTLTSRNFSRLKDALEFRNNLMESN